MSARNIATLPPEAFLRLPEVVALVGLSRASIYARAAQQSFPHPVKLSTHASAWRCGEVRDWLADPTGWKPSGRYGVIKPTPTMALDIDDMPQAKAWLAQRGVDLDALMDASDAVQIVSGRVGSGKLVYRLPAGAELGRTIQIKGVDGGVNRLR